MLNKKEVKTCDLFVEYCELESMSNCMVIKLEGTNQDKALSAAWKGKKGRSDT